MKKMTYYLLGGIVLICVLCAVFLLNPLRKSNNKIREDMLTIAPIGTSMEDVLKIIEENKTWTILQNGEWKPWGSDTSEVTSLYKNHFSETKRIISVIGKYRNFFVVTVGVQWDFDEELKLIDVKVKKEADTW